MSKLTLTDITSGYGTATKINANNTLIETAMENTLSLDGTAPNQMSASLDMNSNRILNLAAPESSSDAARWQDVVEGLELTGTAVPALTGNNGKFLTTDGNTVSWAAVSLDTAYADFNSAAPLIRLNESDAAANNRLWSFEVVAEQFRFKIWNDAIGASGTIFTVDRTGTTVDSLAFSPAITMASTLGVTGQATFDLQPTVGGIKLGFENVARHSGAGGTADATWKSKCYATTAGVTIPNAVFSAGDVLSVYNDSASSVTLTQGASLTLRQAGSTNTGNRTLAARGYATIWFNSASEAILQGAGIT